MNHNLIDDGEAVDCMFGVRSCLLIEHVEKLAEQLLELQIIVELSLRLCIRCEKNLEVGVKHVIAEVCDERLVDT